jgi:hypothetical protein
VAVMSGVQLGGLAAGALGGAIGDHATLWIAVAGAARPAVAVPVTAARAARPAGRRAPAGLGARGGPVSGRRPA